MRKLMLLACLLALFCATIYAAKPAKCAKFVKHCTHTAKFAKAGFCKKFRRCTKIGYKCKGFKEVKPSFNCVSTKFCKK